MDSGRSTGKTAYVVRRTSGIEVSISATDRAEAMAKAQQIANGFGAPVQIKVFERSMLQPSKGVWIWETLHPIVA